MKRVHVHVAVDDLAKSVRFYQSLFGAEPTVLKADYAKWMLDDPRLNFAISTRGATATGIRHLGIQTETGEELHEVYDRLRKAAAPLREEGATTCCYARSEKAWTADPQGVMWETFMTSGESATYGNSADLVSTGGAGACCAPETQQSVCCPAKAGLPPDAPCCPASAAA